MGKKFGTLLILIAVALGGVVGEIAEPAAAQSPDAWTSYTLNMRTGPGPDYTIVTALPPDTALIFEARTDDIAWLLGHTADGTYRGWVSALYLTYATGFAGARLPVSGEIVDAGAAPAAPDVQAPADEPPADTSTVGTEGTAPTGISAWTDYDLNVRGGPGTTHRAVGSVPGGTGLVLEARNNNSMWVLAHTQDGTIRGWLAASYLRFNVQVDSLPVSSETVSGGASGIPAPSEEFVSYNDIPLGGFNPARVSDIDLGQVPIVAQSTARARAIYLNGQVMGNNSGVLAKVGDCSSEHWYFLSPFGWGRYNLGSYGSLQSVIDHFGDSLTYDSEASHNGFNVNSVMAPEWANPAMCQQGESPLECEYRLHKPSVAVIMFGTSDLLVMTPYEFDFYLRDVVEQSIDAGVIPVLSTFPGNKNFWNRTIFYNQIVVRVAWDYDVPLINLWRALEDLPNSGLEADGFHLGEPDVDANACNLANPAYGYTVRNLVTMQSLDAVWRGAMR